MAAAGDGNPMVSRFGDSHGFLEAIVDVTLMALTFLDLLATPSGGWKPPLRSSGFQPPSCYFRHRVAKKSTQSVHTKRTAQDRMICEKSGLLEFPLARSLMRDFSRVDSKDSPSSSSPSLYAR